MEPVFEIRSNATYQNKDNGGGAGQVEIITSPPDMLNFRYVVNSSRYIEEADGNMSLQIIREIIIVKIYYSTRINICSSCLKITCITHS